MMSISSANMYIAEICPRPGLRFWRRLSCGERLCQELSREKFLVQLALAATTIAFSHLPASPAHRLLEGHILPRPPSHSDMLPFFQICRKFSPKSCQPFPPLVIAPALCAAAQLAGPGNGLLTTARIRRPHTRGRGRMAPASLEFGSCL